MSLAGLDPVVHEPTRLRICAFLAPLEEAEFGALREELAVSESVLSKHFSRLEAEGYAKRRRDVFDGRRVWASLTRTGRLAFTAHVGALREIAGLV